MASRLYGGLLVLGCVILAGCWSAGDVDEKISSTKPSSGRTSTAPIAEPSIPSVQYLAVDGLAPAVIVAGHSLAYTRQMLPVDAEGTLVGEGSAEMQIDQVLANVEKLLAESGSGLDRLVKVNVYADSAETADLFGSKCPADSTQSSNRPFVPLFRPYRSRELRIAVDAVAIADHQGNDVVLRRCQGVAGDKNCADVAVMPRSGVVYLSGQPDKSPLAEATVKSMTTQLDVLDQLELQPSQIAQLKVFVDSASPSRHGAQRAEKVIFRSVAAAGDVRPVDRLGAGRNRGGRALAPSQLAVRRDPAFLYAGRREAIAHLQQSGVGADRPSDLHFRSCCA